MVPFAILASLLSVCAYKSAWTVRSDDDSRAQTAAPSVIKSAGIARPGPSTKQSPPMARDYARSPSQEPSMLSVPNKEAFANEYLAVPDDSHVDRDIEVSIQMQDGTIRTFTGAGVMFSASGNAMQIPAAGYRILPDGTFQSHGDVGADARRPPSCDSPPRDPGASASPPRRACLPAPPAP